MIAAGIMSFNAVTSMRHPLLVDTIESAARVFGKYHLNVYDVGSTDGSDELAHTVDGRVFAMVKMRDPGGNHTTGMGTVMMGDRLADAGANVIVCSDDDMVWHDADAADKLLSFWRAAPPDIALVSGLLEPEWHWNTPREVVEYGGVRVLLRDSAPGAAWSFRASLWPTIKSHVKRDVGHDYDACVALRREGYRVGQLDLADHAGWEYSTHGNRAIESAKPLDRKRWGV